jgi:hypothetical protein
MDTGIPSFSTSCNIKIHHLALTTLCWLFDGLSIARIIHPSTRITSANGSETEAGEIHGFILEVGMIFHAHVDHW